MKTRLITTALVATVFFAVGSGFGTHHSTDSVATVTGAAPKTLQTSPSPVAVKRAPERIATAVTLPEITVRPSREEVIAAFAASPAKVAANLPASSVAKQAISEGTSGDEPAALPRLNFDMPYYSFGKVLPSVSRE